MRFSLGSVLLALPLLTSASVETQDPLTQAKDTVQHFLGRIASYIPHYNTFHEAEAAAARAGGRNINILSLSNWSETLRGSVTAASKGPEEWWVLITGGNKTCWGHCEGVNMAFNETALLFKADPTAPHLAYINCDHQPILCNSWAAGPPSLYIMEVTPEPAPVAIHIQTLNATSVAPKDFLKLHATGSWKDKPAYEGVFHPFDGQIAKLGLGVPIGWFLWCFSILPNWLFMILISFASRGVMGRRGYERLEPRPAGPGPAAPAPRR